jgi:hypothetical protein
VVRERDTVDRRDTLEGSLADSWIDVALLRSITDFGHLVLQADTSSASPEYVAVTLPLPAWMPVVVLAMLSGLAFRLDSFPPRDHPQQYKES